MNTQEIVWIFGSSASGKERFIERISSQEEPLLSKTLGWTDKKILVNMESVDWIGQLEEYDADPVAIKRSELIDVIANQAKQENVVILIKGQDVDLENDRPRILKNRLPNAHHRILFLHASLDELYDRCKNKPWWKSKWTRDTVEEWLLYQLKYIKSLQNEFDIATIRSEKGKEYIVMEFPPTIY